MSSIGKCVYRKCEIIYGNHLVHLCTMMVGRLHDGTCANCNMFKPEIGVSVREVCEKNAEARRWLMEEFRKYVETEFPNSGCLIGDDTKETNEITNSLLDDALEADAAAVLLEEHYKSFEKTYAEETN